jgi:hypothetical protein
VQRFTPIILATWEPEIWRIVVQGQPGKKVSKNPISTNNLVVVVLTHNINYAGGIGRKIVV